jgi:hypothetical protein
LTELHLFVLGNNLGDSGCENLAASISNLSLLRVLNLRCKFNSVILLRCVSSSSQLPLLVAIDVGSSGQQALVATLPKLSQLQELYLNGDFSS